MTTHDGPCCRCYKKKSSSTLPLPVEFHNPVDEDGKPMVIGIGNVASFHILGHHFCENCEDILKKSRLESLKYLKNCLNEFIKEITHDIIKK